MDRHEERRRRNACCVDTLIIVTLQYIRAALAGEADESLVKRMISARDECCKLLRVTRTSQMQREEPVDALINALINHGVCESAATDKAIRDCRDYAIKRMVISR